MSLTVIGLMIVVALGSWLVRRQRPTILLLSSIIALYALQPAGLEIALPTATLLLVVGVWWLVSSSGESRRRLALAFVVAIILILVILKLPTLQATLTSAIAQNSGQAFPLTWQWLGFSYIAFRLMHVLLDFRSQRLQPVSLRDFALYVIFFPAVISGPIDRVEHFTRELHTERQLDAERIVKGGTRIGIGLFKKFVLADSLSYIALRPALVSQTNGSTISYWIMLYAYTFQLYLDFAGYTDLGIGIAHLAGITLPENFTAPYLKRNIAAFWNSWHITLSAWFRVYFFTPFSRALMRTSLHTRRFLVILIAQLSTMVLIGLWHGIAVNFVLWGLWHGLGLWLHRWLTSHTQGWDAYVVQRPRLAIAIHVLSVVFTFHFIAIGWVFFGLLDTRLIVKMLAGLVGLHG